MRRSTCETRAARAVRLPVAGGWPLAWALALLLAGWAGLGWAANAAQGSRPLVILVPGIVEELGKPSDIWGRFEEEVDQSPHWTGMIGYLDQIGYRFGGTVCSGSLPLDLPERLDLRGVAGQPEKADCFLLRYSQNAATDGIALKSMELSTCIARLREFTGRKKVYLLAHSAGGLVARAYLQNAFPDVLRFRGDVDRLITISTPHLGSALAEHWGDWLGTRATSLKTTASLLKELNDDLDLPHGVCFASIVVRGIWNDVSGDGPDYDRLVDHAFLQELPDNFRTGGDQVLSVRTQNLRLARCAARYEQSSQRAVQYVVARVRKESPEYIHNTSLGSRPVQEWVHVLLADGDGCWRGFDSPADRAAWIGRQATGCAFGLVENEARSRHWAAGVEGGSLEVGCIADRPQECLYRFSADVSWRRRLIGIFSVEETLTGVFRLSTDSFGRVRGCRFEIEPTDEALPLEQVAADAAGPPVALLKEKF